MRLRIYKINRKVITNQRRVENIEEAQSNDDMIVMIASSIDSPNSSARMPETTDLRLPTRQREDTCARSSLNSQRAIQLAWAEDRS